MAFVVYQETACERQRAASCRLIGSTHALFIGAWAQHLAGESGQFIYSHQHATSPLLLEQIIQSMGPFMHATYVATMNKSYISNATTAEITSIAKTILTSSRAPTRNRRTIYLCYNINYITTRDFNRPTNRPTCAKPTATTNAVTRLTRSANTTTATTTSTVLLQYYYHYYHHHYHYCYYYYHYYYYYYYCYYHHHYYYYYYYCYYYHCYYYYYPHYNYYYYYYALYHCLYCYSILYLYCLQNCAHFS